MKKFILFIGTLFVMVSGMQAQSYSKSMDSYKFGNTDSLIHGVHYFPKDIVSVQVKGPAWIAWVQDTVNFVESFVLMEKEGFEKPSWKGNTLTLNNKNRAIYLLHIANDAFTVTCTEGAYGNEINDKEVMSAISRGILMATATSSKLAKKTNFNEIYKLAFQLMSEGLTQSTLNVPIEVIQEPIEVEVIPDEMLPKSSRQNTDPRRAEDFTEVPIEVVVEPIEVEVIPEEMMPKSNRQNTDSMYDSTWVEGYYSYWDEQFEKIYFEVPLKAHAYDLIYAGGKCAVAVVNDGKNYIAGLTLNCVGPEEIIENTGSQLYIDDPNPGIYVVHTSWKHLSFGDNSPHSIVRQVDENEAEKLEQILKYYQSGGDKRQITKLNKTLKMAGLNSEEVINRVIDESSANDTKLKVKYTRDDRLNFDFHWGFQNWGSAPYSGFMGMSEPSYNVRTSFSSFQLSENYSLVMTRHFACGIGVGYESDVYKFNEPYVDYVDGNFAVVDNTPTNGYYSTNFVTRYVQLPIHFTYYAQPNHNKFHITMSVIPAIGYCSNHTGIKHELHRDGRNAHDQHNINDALYPFKMDVRLDMKFRGIGVFVQMATLPVLMYGKAIYPLKIGFSI